MPISDEEAYRQGKRIAADMLRGTYHPAKDYSSDHTSQPVSRGEVSPLAAVIGCLTLTAIFGVVVWLVWNLVF